MGNEKKNLLDKAIDALTTRDGKEAAEMAEAEARAAQREVAARRSQTQTDKAASDRVAARKAAARMAKAADDGTARTGTAPQKGVVTTRSLRVRSDHHTSAEVVAGLLDGTEVEVLGTWSDGRNTWAKLENGWAAIEFNGETYIRLA